MMLPGSLKPNWDLQSIQQYGGHLEIKLEKRCHSYLIKLKKRAYKNLKRKSRFLHFLHHSPFSKPPTENHIRLKQYPYRELDKLVGTYKPRHHLLSFAKVYDNPHLNFYLILLQTSGLMHL